MADASKGPFDEIRTVRTWKPVTASDTLPLPYGRCRAIWVGTAGDVNVLNEDGSTQVIPGVLAGMAHPISTTQILSGSTTAVTILAGY